MEIETGAKKIPNDRLAFILAKSLSKPSRVRSSLRVWLDRIVEPVPPLRTSRAKRQLRYRMEAALGYKPDLQHPRTFNEKIAWRMLYDRDPLIPLTIDKLAVRGWVAARVGADRLVPLFGSWHTADDIDWASLPNRFVLKATHGWNMNLLVYDKSTIDKDATLATAARWLQTNHYVGSGEWGYRNIPPRLLAEEMQLDANGEIATDLKFYVFHGRVRILRVHTGRFGLHRVTFLDEHMNILPLSLARPTDPDWVPPKEIGSLIDIAERLGNEFDHVRVDLYLVKGKPRFGELTHYDTGACSAYNPHEFDKVIGDMW